MTYEAELYADHKRHDHFIYLCGEMGFGDDVDAGEQARADWRMVRRVEGLEGYGGEDGGIGGERKRRRMSEGTELSDEGARDGGRDPFHETGNVKTEVQEDEKEWEEKAEDVEMPNASYV
ncbi:hypothetical protein HDV00_012148 [Rhizophlyctis rosea]|nr:hypothetical protein HDV00_012148 [Rhizophlyctis rosea]